MNSKSIPHTIMSTLRCSVCSDRLIEKDHKSLRCSRCNAHIEISDNILRLLPERMSFNNTRELSVRHPVTMWHIISSPFILPASQKRSYFEHSQMVRKSAIDIYENASILYLFAGDGLEAHLSGIMNEKTVLSDISKSALKHAQQRVESYRLTKPAAYIQCDAEKLPFDDKSFDIVIAYKGIHHCFVPQSALAEVWRVTKKRAIILDNWQCLLTDFLYKINLSSKIEYSGLKPNRFNKISLQTMLYNAGIENYYIETTMPHFLDRYFGWRGRRFIQKIANRVHQGNTFMLIVDKIGTDLNKLAKSSIAKYESNPTNFMPSEKQPIMPG